ncbi:MAG: HXXEE domain-containing protein [Gemmatimonadota bacterium]
MKVSGWMWLGPLAFAVHDTEEILTVEPWLRAHAGSLPELVQPFATITASQVSFAIAVLSVGYLVATWHGTRAVKAGASPVPFLLLTGAFVGNGVTHGLQALAFRDYVPGLVTAILVSLPYGWGIARACLRGGIASRRKLLWIGGLGLILQVPLALLALLAARSWLPAPS